MPRNRDEVRAFTLVELLVAVALLAFVSLILVGLASQGGKMWALAESQNQHRQRARAMLEFMVAEMREAVLPLDNSRPSLQFVINPSNLDAKFLNRDAVFWQAPIATDESRGDLAEIGYFVRWDGTQANLCRFSLDPSDPDYRIYKNPETWLSDALLDAAAPGDKAGKYRGLFLENVIGMWVKAYQKDGTAYSGDSRTALLLPAYVEISLVLLDGVSAKRVADAAEIRGLYASSPTATAFLAALPTKLRGGATIVSAIVNTGYSR